MAQLNMENIIKSYSKKNNLKPDKICLYNAKLNGLNKNIIEWITDNL